MPDKAVIIGGGFAGLSAATSLATRGFEVTLLEKNAQAGGRARSFSRQGFTFDMGPSWYWMPDVFEQYFNSFDKSVSDYYDLRRLAPSYRVYFGNNDFLDLPSGAENCIELFESIEPGSGSKLRQFLKDSSYKYKVGINDLVYKPGRSWLEFADWRILKGLFQLDLLKSIRSYVHSHFKDVRLRNIVEFPILFLGGTPKDTPALYSLMNYADMELGTWYPMGGMHEIAEAMVSLAREKGVEIALNSEVTEILVENKQAKKVRTAQKEYEADVVVGAGDYHHIEQQLLPAEYRQYSEKYWEQRTMAPSSLLMYLGVSKKLKGLQHHNLLFDENLDAHAREIYSEKKWPDRPLFYASVTSQTDPSVAPEGCENLFLLMPVAPGIEDNEAVRQKYSNLMIERLEKLTQTKIKPHIIFSRTYAHRDFEADYHSYKGNAYGLANTLKQTAFLKPSLKSSKIKNVYYTGQLTVPGPGVPPALISGQIVAGEVEKDCRKNIAG